MSETSSPKRTVLLADDTAVQLKLSKIRLEDAGFQVVTAGTATEALEVAKAAPPDVILSDVVMPDLDGFTLCRKLLEEPALASTPIVLVSAHFRGPEDQALADAVGACALVQRTPDFAAELEAVRLALEAPREIRMVSDVARTSELFAKRIAAQLSELAQASRGLEEALRSHQPASASVPLPQAVDGGVFFGLVGASEPMRRLARDIRTAGAGRGPALIVGESGTGKELIARAIHTSAFGEKPPFVPVNCAAFPKELIESELFGHAKGAYTGASGDYAGLVRAAAGGTLFLDEVTEMAAETQAKLLRVIEERMVRPLGTLKELPVDVRFVASTNRDPEEAVQSGVLRKDLYHRLCVFRLAVPPLRTRLDDVPLLVRHFVDRLADRGLRKVDSIDSDAMEVLRSYGWPGNVRELRNAIEHALAAGSGSRLRAADLPPHLQESRAVVEGVIEGISPESSIPTMEEAEVALIRRALAATNGNKLRAAMLLRISRHRLYDRLNKLRVDNAR